jgi:hypothetical protein
MIDEALWLKLETDGREGSGRVQRRVFPSSANDIYVAVSYPANQRMLAVTGGRQAFLAAGSRLHNLSQTEGIEVAVEPLSDGTSELRVVLTSPDLAAVFTPLVDDIAEVAADSGPERVIVDAVDRFARWLRLMRLVADNGLGREARLGLFGELAVLRDHLLPNLPEHDAVYGWTGPDSADQDFQLARCAVEVKATKNRTGASLTIANERQLDSTGTGLLFLVGLFVDERQGGSGISLPSLVADVRDRLTSAGARGRFDRTLAMTGYFDSQANRYAEPRYTIASETIWLVADGFPRLTPAILPQGVHGCSYSITPASLAEFTRETAEFHNAVRNVTK